MADYIKDTGAVVQNLKDAGCDEDVVEEFMELAEAGERKRLFKLLERQRRLLVDSVHSREKQIDCLDYLVFQIRKETQEK